MARGITGAHKSGKTKSGPGEPKGAALSRKESTSRPEEKPQAPGRSTSPPHCSVDGTKSGAMYRLLLAQDQYHKRGDLRNIYMDERHRRHNIY